MIRVGHDIFIVGEYLASVIFHFSDIIWSQQYFTFQTLFYSKLKMPKPLRAPPKQFDTFMCMSAAVIPRRVSADPEIKVFPGGTTGFPIYKPPGVKVNTIALHVAPADRT